ncbi:MAG: hypothetical protein EXR69_11155 [Myxococcales bacterium]|nr:hypothetical protein [Myxococcales bacterium]
MHGVCRRRRGGDHPLPAAHRRGDRRLPAARGRRVGRRGRGAGRRGRGTWRRGRGHVRRGRVLPEGWVSALGVRSGARWGGLRRRGPRPDGRRRAPGSLEQQQVSAASGRSPHVHRRFSLRSSPV